MREKEKSTTVIYVRHGKTDFPIDRIYCDDREDPPLNSEGEEHARFAAGHLKNQSIDIIYCSPYQRTRMTTEAIVQATAAPVQEARDLRERGFGIWDGLYFDEIAHNYPEEFVSWKQDPVHYSPPGAESMEEVLQRVTGQLNRILAEHRGETVVVVSHVGPIRLAISDAIGLPTAHYRRLGIDYGALSRVDYGRSQNNLIYMNINSSQT